jgi:hypothetical protein
MARADLIALSYDDLVALTNRGTVKRAQRELETNEVTGDLKEIADGTVSVQWSDGIVCLLPGNTVVSNSRCTCPATELCRHVIRAVLAYQQQHLSTQSTQPTTTWNPGSISDEELAKHFKPTALTMARNQFHNGLLIEVLKSNKPTARFHDLACTLRFQVAGDVRYVHCDCAADPPCIHVPLAVWAFRQLPDDKTAAIISTQTKPLTVPLEVLDQIDETMLAGLEFGLAGAGNPWRDQLSRLETQCRQAGLIWPAEVLVDLIHQLERYAEHDARFSPERFVELVGELLIRADAIRNDTGAVPQLLIRGTASDHRTELASSRFIGLGCGFRLGRKRVTLTAYLQDANSGSMVALGREFPDPPADRNETPKKFWRLAQTPVIKGASFAQIGAGQLLTQGGKRATNHELVLGRVKATINPQNFAWESLRSPVLAESFAEIRERLRLLPPTALRPRRVAEDFHVCAISAVENATFVPATQTIQAVLKDALGDSALLRHPFTHRGSEGAERLLACLTGDPSRIQFVAGPMRMTSDGLCVEPVAVVVQEDGRRVLQPWIDREHQATTGAMQAREDLQSPDPVEALVRALGICVSDLMIVGLRRADSGVLRAWRELNQTTATLGLARLGQVIQRVVSGLDQKAATVQWSWQPTGRALLELAVLTRMSQELGG